VTIEETTMDRSARYWDRIASRYSRQPIKDEATYQKKLEVTREYLRPDMKVLEFGCGTGSTAILHAPYVEHILATDVSPRMIEIANDKAVSEDIDNVTFECAAVDTLSVSDQSLDAVMGHNILHLVAEWEETIAKVYRMLKPGGIFITSTACIGDMTRIFKIIAPVGQFLRLIPLVKVFTTAELKTSLTDAGFEIDHEWHPGKNKAVFIVAKKTA
jgi:ubiquinone/menaquinone biosynthesis C-methylase UbiE